MQRKTVEKRRYKDNIAVIVEEIKKKKYVLKYHWLRSLWFYKNKLTKKSKKVDKLNGLNQILINMMME